MNKCIGVGNKVCGVEFFDPEFPDDNVCDKCAEELEGEGEDYLASDCTKCGQEFNYREHKSDTCIYCEEESEACTRCGNMVESESLVTYGDWKLCELCQGDI